MIDFGQVASNIFSAIPWWFYPLIILVIFLKTKMNNFDYEQKIRKKEKIYDKINKEKENNDLSKHTQLTNKQKKEKGDRYEAYICKDYEEKNYIVIANGKNMGIHDQGIDIIAKKDKELLFIQCKDWNSDNKYKIGNKDIQYIRMNARDYLEQNPELKEYDWKIYYIVSDYIFTENALHKMNEYENEIQYKIIPMK